MVKLIKYEEDILKQIIHEQYKEVNVIHAPVGIIVLANDVKKAFEVNTYSIGESFEDAQEGMRKLLTEYPEEKFYISFYKFFIQNKMSDKEIERCFDSNRFLKRGVIPVSDIACYNVRLNFYPKYEQ